jgi:hypothetical protein
MKHWAMDITVLSIMAFVLFLPLGIRDVEELLILVLASLIIGVVVATTITAIYSEKQP